MGLDNHDLPEDWYLDQSYEDRFSSLGDSEQGLKEDLFWDQYYDYDDPRNQEEEDDEDDQEYEDEDEDED